MQREKTIAGNTATGMLKLIALGLMFVDHAGKMLCGNMLEMRLIGRMAFPLYCWCMVVGASHTRSMPRYILRVVLVGVLSQPLYMLALNHTWDEANIFLTLALALVGLWGIREHRWLSQWWAPAVALVLAVATGCDYGWQGVLLVFLLYGVRDSRCGIAAVMIAFCLYWGSTSSPVSVLFGQTLQWQGALGKLIAPWMRIQSLAILSLPLMLIRFPKDVHLPRWAGYALYPLHLAVLALLEYCL